MGINFKTLEMCLTPLAAILVLVVGARIALADGGVMRAREEQAGWLIYVATSPQPLVPGLVDVSVLLQDASSLKVDSAAEVRVRITPRERPDLALDVLATPEAATNKLFRACLVELSPGWHDVSVTCAHDGRVATLNFAMEVGNAAPTATSLWPWIAWPVVPVLFFAIRQRRIFKRRRIAQDLVNEKRAQGIADCR